MDTRHGRRMDEEVPSMPAEDELRADMEQSDRDVEAGLTVPLEEVLAEIDHSTARMKARRRARRA